MTLLRRSATAALFVLAACSVALASPASDTIQREQEMLNPTVQVIAGNTRGSGTVIRSGPDGVFILTNEHVVSKATKVKIKFWTFDANGASSDSGATEPVSVVAQNDESDLALLRINDPDFRAPAVAVMAPVGEAPLAGEDIFVAGAGLGHRVYLTRGLLGIVADSAFEKTAIMTSGPTLPGNSGGSLWHMAENGHYEMIGVPRAMASLPIESPFEDTLTVPVPTMNFAIPLATVRAFLDANGQKLADR